MMDAKHIYLLMKKEYRISRNIRASWYFNRLNDVIKYTPLDEIFESSDELSIISVVPSDERINLVKGVEYTFRVTPQTNITFLARRYRLVFALDLSPSITSLDLYTGEILLDEVFSVLSTCLKALVQPVTVPGVGASFCPQLHTTLIVHTPVLSNTTNEVLTQGFLLSHENVDDFLAEVEKKLIYFENCLADSFQKVAECGEESSYLSERVTNPEANFINLLRCGILALQLLPENSSAGVIVITDGLIGIPDATLFESLMIQLRNATIPCSFLQVGATHEAASPLGRVTHHELMRFIAEATFGAYFTTKPYSAMKSVEPTQNAYHQGLLFWTFQNNLEGFNMADNLQDRYSELTEDLAWTNRENIISPTVCKKHNETTLRVGILTLLSVRLREGYTVKEVTISPDTGILKVILMKPWRDFVWIEYVASTAWPLTTTRETNIEVGIKGSYEFLHDITFSVKATYQSPYRLAVIKKFWHTLQSISETDQLLEHLQSFNQKPVFYTINDSIRSGVPLFHLPVNSTTPTVNTQDLALRDFAAFWKPIVMLDINIWQKWLHSHRIGLVLEHDATLPKYLYMPNSSGRHQTVQCQNAATCVSMFLREWSTFVLMENHSYIRFVYSQSDKRPTSFYILRATAKPPCLVLRVAFPPGTPGHDRNLIITQLRDAIAALRFPQKPDKQSASTSVGRKTPLTRNWRDIPVCVIVQKPIERILIRYEHIPCDLTCLNPAVPPDSAPVAKKPLYMFSLLCQYLHHKRWVWRMPRADLTHIPVSAVGFVLATLAQLRLQEGFHFTCTSLEGVINLAVEVQMKHESSDALTTCVVQYILFPPHAHNTKTSEFDTVILEGTEDDGELQLVTECWVEPQCGVVVDSPHESDRFNGLRFHQLPQVLFPVDYACVSSLVNFELLKDICRNGLLNDDLLNCKRDVSTSPDLHKDNTISSVNVPFDVTFLLPRSQQIEMLFSAFITDVKTGHEESNKILLHEFFTHLQSRHDQEILLSDTQCQKFIQRLEARQTNENDWTKFVDTETVEEEPIETDVKWRCFIKIESDKLILFTFVPFSYDDVKKLPQNAVIEETMVEKESDDASESVLKTETEPETLVRNNENTDSIEVNTPTVLEFDKTHQLPHILVSTASGSSPCQDSDEVVDVELNEGLTTNTNENKPETDILHDQMAREAQNSLDDRDSVFVDDCAAKDTREHDSAKPGLNMPVYVYATLLSNVTDSLVHRWDFALPADTSEDFRQFYLEQFPRQNSLSIQCLEMEIEVDASDKASAKGNSLDRHSNDSVTEIPCVIKTHTDMILDCYFDSYVTGVFQSLERGHDVHHNDMDCAINKMCQESVPLEIDMKSYMQTSCGHITNAVRAVSKQCDDVRLQDSSEPTNGMKNVQFLDLSEDRRVNPSLEVTAPVNLAVADISQSRDCERTVGLHQSIRDKFLATVHKFFKPVPSLPDFYFFHPDEPPQQYREDLHTDSFSGDNTGLTSDLNASGDKADLEGNLMSDPEDIINITDAIFTATQQQQTRLSTDSNNAFDASFDQGYDDSFYDGDVECSPLFICFTCTLKTKYEQHYVSVRLLPTCFGELTQSLPQNISTIDLSDLKLTFDLNCLSRVKDTDAEKSKHYSNSYFHSSVSEFVSEANNLNKSLDEISQRCSQTGEHLRHLSHTQRHSVVNCIHEIEWLLQDEVVSSLRHIQPVTLDTLSTVTRHTHKSAADENKPGCIHKTINLQFVYGSNSSMVKFTEDFCRMWVVGYRLCTVNDYNYLVLDRNNAHALALKYALDELNKDGSADQRASVESDVGGEKSGEVERAKTGCDRPRSGEGFVEQSSERLSVEKETLKPHVKEEAGVGLGVEKGGGVQSFRSKELRRSGSSVGEGGVDGGSVEKHSLRSNLKELSLGVAGQEDRANREIYKSDSNLSRSRDKQEVQKERSKSDPKGQIVMSEKFVVIDGAGCIREKQRSVERDVQKVEFKSETESVDKLVVDGGRRLRDKQQSGGSLHDSDRSRDEKELPKLDIKRDMDSLERLGTVESPRKREKQKSGSSIGESKSKEKSRLVAKRHSDVVLTDDILSLNDVTMETIPTIRASKSSDSITNEIRNDASSSLKIRLIKDDDTRLRNLSGISGPDTPLSLISTQPQTPSWLSSTGSYTEDGYDAGLSESESEDFTSLTDPYTAEPALPDFWLIMHIIKDIVHVYFHIRLNEEGDTEEMARHYALLDIVTSKVQQICRVVNQKLLLEELLKTKMCDPLLVPAADEDVSWTKDLSRDNKLYQEYDYEEEGGEYVSQKYISSALLVSPGQFACDRVWSSQFLLHPRISSATNIKGQHKGLQLLEKTVLFNFSVINRKNMFVYKENNTDAIFYLKLEEISGCSKDESSLLPDINADPNSTATRLFEVTDPKGDYDAISNNSSSTHKSVQSLSTQGDVVQLSVYGICAPGSDICVDLQQALQKRLDTTVLELLTRLLHRNHMSKLTQEDVHYIQKPHTPACRTLYLSLPSHHMPYLYAFNHYLSQNLRLFLLPPNYADVRHDHRFGDFVDGQWQVVTDGTVYLYNNPESLGHKGLVCITTALVDQGDNVRHLIGCPIPETDGYVALMDSCHEFDKMIEISDWTPGDNQPLSLCPVVRFHMWDQGHADMESLEACLRDAVRQALCDVITEYHLMTAPLCEVPPDDELAAERRTVPQSAPASPRNKENKEKRFIHGGAVSDVMKTPLRPTVSSPSPLHQFFHKKAVSPSPSTKESPKTFDFANAQTKRRNSGIDHAKIAEIASSQKQDLSSRRQMYECGDYGCVHPVFINVAMTWLDFAVAQGCPSVTKTELQLASHFSIDIVLREFRSYMMTETKAVKLQAFQIVRKCSSDGEKLVGLRYSSPRQSLSIVHTRPPLVLDNNPLGLHHRNHNVKDAESESSLDVVKSPANLCTKRFLLIGRNHDDWVKVLSQQNNTTAQDDNKTPVRKISKDGKTHWQKFTSYEGRCQSGETSESCFVPRQTLLLLNVTRKTVSLYLYNYQVSVKVSRYFTLLVDWQNARSHLLHSHVCQKMGLYHHSVFTVKPPALNDNYFTKFDIDERLLLNTTPCKAETLRQHHGSGAPGHGHPDNPGKMRRYHLTFRNVVPPRVTHRTGGCDPVVSHLNQAEAIRAKLHATMEKEDKLERLFVEWNRRPNTNTPISEDYLRTLKRSSRLVHYCATPLLFSPHWRRKALSKRGEVESPSPAVADTRHLSVSSRVRHNSGASTDGLRQRHAESLDSKKRPGDTPRPLYVEEAWHAELRSRFIAEYINYLMSQQFVRIHTRPSSPKRSKTSSSRKPPPVSSQPEKMFRDSMLHHMQKTTADGIIMIQAGFQHVHFCVKLYGMSSTRQSRTPFINQQRFVENCDKYRDLIHVHSFAHDYHLRTMQAYIEDRPSHIPDTYNINAFLRDFVSVYSYPPSFARNYIHRGTISFSGITTSSTQLFDYMRSHYKLYQMQTLTMVPSHALVDPSSNAVEEHALVSTNFSADTESLQQAHGYNTGLVIGLDTSHASDVDDVLHLCFFVLLSSERELFPRLKLERRIGAIKAAIMRQLPADKSFTVECHSLSQLPQGSEDGRLLLCSEETPPSTPSSDFSHLTAVNYLGFSNSQQQNMYRLLQSQVKSAREKIGAMVDMSLSQCRRDTLWGRLVTLDSGATSDQDSTGLNYSEFTELLSTVHIVNVWDIDPQLFPLINLNPNNCRGLPTVLTNKYSDTHRRFSSPDQHTHYVVVLSPTVRDVFMILGIFYDKESMILAAVYQEEGVVPRDEATRRDTFALIESFVNACCFSLWSSMLVT